MDKKNIGRTVKFEDEGEVLTGVIADVEDEGYVVEIEGTDIAYILGEDEFEFVEDEASGSDEGEVDEEQIDDEEEGTDVDVSSMGKDELKVLIREHGIKVPLNAYKNVEVLREHVAKALGVATPKAEERVKKQGKTGRMKKIERVEKKGVTEKVEKKTVQRGERKKGNSRGAAGKGITAIVKTILSVLEDGGGERKEFVKAVMEEHGVKVGTANHSVYTTLGTLIVIGKVKKEGKKYTFA